VSEKIFSRLWMVTGLGALVLVVATIGLGVKARSQANQTVTVYTVDKNIVISLYAEPSMASRIVTVLERGEPLAVTDYTNRGDQTWYHVNTKTGSGWIHANHLSLNSPTDAAQEVSEQEPTAVPESEAAEEEMASAPGFTVHDSTPVFEGGASAAWDARIASPGAIVFHDGLFHMFYTGTTDWSQPVSIGYATSEDGSTWERTNEPVLTPDAVDYAFFAIMSSSVLVEDDGTWVMYFYTQNTSDRQGAGAIGRATAPGPTGPWTPDDVPALQPGSYDAWDEYSVRNPNVVKTDDGYAMYYTGITRLEDQWRASIGLATSPDGIIWTKHDDPATTDEAFAGSDIVFPSGISVREAGWVCDPHVWRTPGEWRMVHFGTPRFDRNESLGYATSTDGIAWSPFEDAQVFIHQAIRGGTRSGDTALLYHDGTYYLYYRLLRGDDTAVIHLATSEQWLDANP